MSGDAKDDRVEKHPPPHILDMQVVQHWYIATPSVYRYEDQKWIDKFFESGLLRLSTFAKFATYPDEIRGDRNEGSAVCFGETRDNKTMVLVQQQGGDAVVLSCSHRLDHQLRESFQRDSAFQITNTMAFGFEIARQLPGFQKGLEGSCLYRTDNSIKRVIDIDVRKYERPDGTIDLKLATDGANALGGPELVLLKRKSYEAQCEYRLLWYLDQLKAEFIDVRAPKARQYCRKVKPEEY